MECLKRSVSLLLIIKPYSKSLAQGRSLSTSLISPLYHQSPNNKKLKTLDFGMYKNNKKQPKPVTEELNKVSPLITRVWTGLRQEKPWPLAGSRCGGPKGGGPQLHQTPKPRADRPALLPVYAGSSSQLLFCAHWGRSSKRNHPSKSQEYS